MLDFQCKESYSVNDLTHIVRILRGEGGCPWDREQTHESIRRNFLEETYEAVEAIDEGSPEHLKEELGDVLMQVVFHACIEEEAGRFDLDGVADGVCKKLIYRHPHVFGDTQVSGTEQVLDNWDVLKRREKSQETYTDTLKAVAKSLPSLWRAEKVQKKAKKAGFDWPDASGAVDKLQEELAEVEAAAAGQGDLEEEIGDLLFSVVNVARHWKVDPEMALHRACEKFISRFARVEELAGEGGKAMDQMSLAELDKLWEQAKG